MLYWDIYHQNHLYNWDVHMLQDSVWSFACLRSVLFFAIPLLWDGPLEATFRRLLCQLARG